MKGVLALNPTFVLRETVSSDVAEQLPPVLSNMVNEQQPLGGPRFLTPILRDLSGDKEQGHLGRLQ